MLYDDWKPNVLLNVQANNRVNDHCAAWQHATFILKTYINRKMAALKRGTLIFTVNHTLHYVKAKDRVRLWSRPFLPVEKRLM